MVHSLHQDSPSTRIENGEQPIVSDAKLALVGGDEPAKEAIRLGGRLLELDDDPARDRGVQARQVTRGGLCPPDGPRFQRPSRRFNWAWSIVRPLRISSRAFSRLTRKD